MNMRALMEAVSSLVEMPMIVPNDEAKNVTVSDEESELEYHRVLNSHYNPLAENDHYVVGQIAEDEQGEFFLADIRQKKLCYTAQYEVVNIPGLGRCCTTYFLWKAPDCPVRDIPKRIFFGPMLNGFDAILSDRSHTEAGKAYWIARMTEAADQGLTVGFLDHTGEASIFGGEDIHEWIEKLRTWSQSQDDGESSFFVTRKEI